MKMISKVALVALLGTTALTGAGGVAFAQGSGSEQPSQADDPASEEIVVRGVRIPDEKKETSEISSFLDAESFVRTGDSDIGGALSRVTGLSLSDGKFVVVRGLNERYSSVTLNGSPLPSPEPLRRVVPLDIIPTSILSGTLVQKTFSPEFSAEFGGGLIELRSKAVPDETFFQIGLSVGFDTVTTGERGLTFDGGNLDFLGFDDGTRSVPAPVADQFFGIAPGELLTSLTPEEQNVIDASLDSTRTTVIFEDQVPPNYSVDLAFGGKFDVNDAIRIGGNVALGFSNDFQIRAGRREQGFNSTALFASLPAFTVNDAISDPITNPNGFQFDQDAESAEFVSTQQIAELTGLGVLGVEIGEEHSITSTTLILRSTLKDARIGQGVTGEDETFEFFSENLEFFERQVWQTQLRGEHVFAALGGLKLDWRGAYGQAFRDSPFEREFRRFRPSPDDPFALNFGSGANAGLGESVSLDFSFVDDQNIDAGIDLVQPLSLFGANFDVKFGYNYTDKDRTIVSRSFTIQPPASAPFVFPDSLTTVRNDVLLSPGVLGSDALEAFFNTNPITLDNLESDLIVHAAYLGLDVAFGRYLRIAAGARYETGEQSTFGFGTGQPGAPTFVRVGAGPITDILGNTTTCSALLSQDECDSNFLLPAATITYNPIGNLQLRIGYSQTIARPQFRELTPALFIEDDTDQQVIGNPFLVNSRFENIDARLEYYFSRGQFITLGGFYKDITRPIEAANATQGGEVLVTFINAPSAELFGFEFEFERIFPVGEWLGDAPFGPETELVFRTNYTWSDSSVSTDGEVLLSTVFGGQANVSAVAAAGFIESGRRLQGQSAHLLNIQVGLENPLKNMKATLLANWTSSRIRQVEDTISGGPSVIERLPFSLDFVFSRTFNSPAGPFDIGFKVRNIIGDDYEATQNFADGTVSQFDVFALGRELSASISKRF